MEQTATSSLSAVKEKVSQNALAGASCPPHRKQGALPLPSHRRLATTDLNAATALPFWECHRSGTTQIRPFRVAFLHSAM